MAAPKSHILKVELAADDYAPIVEAAERDGLTPEQWLAKKVICLAPSARRLEESKRRLLKIIAETNVPDADNSHNDAIDRDLAEEYGSDHSDAA